MAVSHFDVMWPTAIEQYCSTIILTYLFMISCAWDLVIMLICACFNVILGSNLDHWIYGLRMHIIISHQHIHMAYKFFIWHVEMRC